ncbi:MAG: hypothetical protein AB7G21_06495 [Dehalococcoidia bacterium]
MAVQWLTFPDPAELRIDPSAYITKLAVAAAFAGLAFEFVGFGAQWCWLRSVRVYVRGLRWIVGATLVVIAQLLVLGVLQVGSSAVVLLLADDFSLGVSRLTRIVSALLAGTAGAWILATVQRRVLRHGGYHSFADAWWRATFQGWLMIAGIGFVASLARLVISGTVPAPQPTWLYVVPALSHALPGLVTGLALKRIVEAQDAPSEDVGAIPEVPSGAPPVQ